MSNTRPSLARKVTPGSEKNRQAHLDQGVRVVVDGDPFAVRLGDVTPQLARELRRTWGGSFNKLINELNDDPDIDSLAALIWLARRVAGEQVELDDVEVTYEQVLGGGFEIEIAGAEEVEDSPEA